MTRRRIGWRFVNKSWTGRSGVSRWPDRRECVKLQGLSVCLIHWSFRPAVQNCFVTAGPDKFARFGTARPLGLFTFGLDESRGERWRRMQREAVRIVVFRGVAVIASTTRSFDRVNGALAEQTSSPLRTQAQEARHLWLPAFSPEFTITS